MNMNANNQSNRVAIQGQSNFESNRQQQQQQPNVNARQVNNQNIFENSQQLSSNFQYQQQLQQIYALEQDCLQKCNQWFENNYTTYKITNEQVKFSTMLELEVFVVQTRNRIKQMQVNCLKYGSIFGMVLGTLFFYLNKDKDFKGELVFRINGLSALGGGIFSYILSKQQNIADIITNTQVNIDFPKFELFFESNLQDIYKLRKRLVN